jgi:hypothetical protein
LLDRIVVIDHDGNVFGHVVDVANGGFPTTIGPAFKFDGSKVAFNAPFERFVVTMQNQSIRRIVVIGHDGNVFGHDVRGNTIGPAFKFDGSKVAFNAPAERFVLTLGNDVILVITNRGDVFGHAMQLSE